jgi:hypothetical protein
LFPSGAPDLARGGCRGLQLGRDRECDFWRPTGPNKAAPEFGSSNVTSMAVLPSCELAVVERLGISHPDQTIDFHYVTEPTPFHVVTAKGVVVHHQFLFGGRLAVRVHGGLQVGETRRFRIVPGAQPSTPMDEIDSVRIVEAAEHYDIATPLIAVRVPRATSQHRALSPIRPCGCATAAGPAPRMVLT